MVLSVLDGIPGGDGARHGVGGGVPPGAGGGDQVGGGDPVGAPDGVVVRVSDPVGATWLTTVPEEEPCSQILTWQTVVEPAISMVVLRMDVYPATEFKPEEDLRLPPQYSTETV